MKQILIATHGKMASGIRYTAELIVGKSAEITTIDAYLTPDDNVEEQFESYFKEHEGDHIFVFTDLMGGSVNQKLMSYAQNEKVTLITGTNLPILMQIMLADENVSDAEIREYIDEARAELKMIQMKKPENTGADEAGAVANTEAASNAQAIADATNSAAAGAKEAQPQATQNAGAISPATFENSTAKIAALRIDDRLIHGQVAMTWTKQLRVQGIIVASDDAAADNTQRMALKMAVPAGIKSLIKPVDEAIRVLNDPRASKMRILVLTRTVKDALKIRKQVGEVEFLNLGNTGRFDGIDVSEKTQLSPTLMLTDAEMDALRELVEIDPKMCMQQVPNDEQKLVKDIIS